MTTILRLLGEKNQGEALEQTVAAVRSGADEPRIFRVDPASFRLVPGAPFAYWVSASVLSTFKSHHSFLREDRFPSIGASTKDDYRYLRLYWETQPTGIATNRETTDSTKWVSFAKGGAFSQFYAPIFLAINWLSNGSDLKASISEYRGSRGWGYLWSAALNGHDYYFRPGLTWPRRINGLSFRILPAGCIFADKGPAAFVAKDDPQELLALCAIVNSAAFGKLVSIQLARTELAQSFEVGLIQQTPVPDLTAAQGDDLATLTRQAWSIQRILDTTGETSHAFILPALLQERLCTFDPPRLRAELATLQAQIDERCFDLYGFNTADRTASLGATATAAAAIPTGEDDDADEEDSTTDGESPADRWAAVLTWAIGVVFGRFDVRIATGARAIPPEPDPFAPLPACSPGMLAGPDGQPASIAPAEYPLDLPSDGILVDEPGHELDMIGRIRRVFDLIFAADTDVRWNEASAALDPVGHDLRTWLRRAAFARHLKTHSKSRRKAPLYWPLSIPSGQFTVWLYAHRVTPDTVFAIRDRVVTPAAEVAALKLARATSAGGPTPSAAQRRDMDILDTQAAELRTLREQLTNLAPLLRPLFDDGIVIWSSVLWPLFTSHVAWQKELRTTWMDVANRSYDWAHLAMRCWPQDVIPKCQTDRSLAIAHNLESVFWYQDADDAWQPKSVDAAAVARLVHERHSPAVAAARDWLLAQSPAGQQSAKSRRAAGSKPIAPRVPRPTAMVAPAAPDLDPALAVRVLAAIADCPDGAAKADVLAATGLDDGTWNRAITALLSAGSVTRTGEKRGTKYLAKVNP